MKKIGLLIGIAGFALGPVFAQTTSPVAAPQEHIHVKRKYNKQGDLVGYDSTYVKTWSSDSRLEGKNQTEVLHQLKKQMSGFFNDSVPGITNGDGFSVVEREMARQQQAFQKAFGRLQADSMNKADKSGRAPDWGQLRRQMQKQFELFMSSDSVGNQSLSFPERADSAFQKWEKEIQKHFQKLQKGTV